MHRNTKIKIRHLTFSYGNRTILDDLSLDIKDRSVTSITGPSGLGKSSFLTAINRLWENDDTARVDGSIRIDFGNGFEEINSPAFPLPLLRKRAAMVFQTPNPLPMSIFKNIAFPLKLSGEKDQAVIRQKVVRALEKAALWKEVKDRLNQPADRLSGGQQQRLCIARALVLEPPILLLGEPTSSLDEASARVIEDLLVSLKETCTIVMVSHYMDQVRRIADYRYVLSDRNLLPG